jgi:hypothetical protein
MLRQTTSHRIQQAPFHAHSFIFAALGTALFYINKITLNDSSIERYSLAMILAGATLGLLSLAYENRLKNLKVLTKSIGHHTTLFVNKVTTELKDPQSHVRQIVQFT